MILISFRPKFNSSSNEPRHDVASIVISVNRDLNYDSNGFKIIKTGTFDEIKSEFNLSVKIVYFTTQSKQ